MIPQAPFPIDLTPEAELAEFRRLQPHLRDVWNALVMQDEAPHTSVVVPSMTLDQSELRKLAGASFYEERLLFLLIRLRNPRARVVYVTSQPVHPMILDYYFQLLAGIPASHARSRLTLLCAYDASPRSLTEKILERPRLIERIREGIQDRSRAYLTVFNSTPLERKLAVLLGIPLNGADPDLYPLGTKSGSRKVFREAGVALPEGFEDLRGQEDVEEALIELAARRPGIRRAVVKLNDSFSGEGNAIFRYPQGPEAQSRAAVREALQRIEFSVAQETFASYFEKFSRMEGIVEEFVEGAEKVSPSAQLRISPRGRGAADLDPRPDPGRPERPGLPRLQLPARDEYRLRILEAAKRIGEVLAARGVVSRFAIDFLLWRNDPSAAWDMAALEINLRMGGTTHPYLALQFLTGGQLDHASGLFYSPTGMPKYYRATDNLHSDSYRGLLPEDVIDILTENRLHYSHGTDSGVLFHLIGAVSEFGKLGLTAIGNSREEADALYYKTLEVLDRETAYGRRAG